MQIPADGLHPLWVSRGFGQFLRADSKVGVRAQSGEGLWKGETGTPGNNYLIGAWAVLLTHMRPAQQGPAAGPQSRGDAFPALHLYLQVRPRPSSMSQASIPRSCWHIPAPACHGARGTLGGRGYKGRRCWDTGGVNFTGAGTEAKRAETGSPTLPSPSCTAETWFSPSARSSLPTSSPAGG